MIEYILPPLLFCASVAFTPGPNNIMLMVSVRNFGFWQTVPHGVGVVIGVALLYLGVAAGADQLVREPFFYLFLKYVGSAYLLYLAWRIAHIDTDLNDDVRENRKSRPMRFIEAFLFQWINPKAWLMLLGVIFTFVSPELFWTQASAVFVILVVVSSSSALTWMLLGSLLQSLLRSGKLQKCFNISMALVLAATVLINLF